eukprot:jgi/Chlat1/3435/Chrsp23S03755
MLRSSHGIAAADLKRLHDVGLTSVESVAYATRRELVKIKGFSEQKAEKVLAAVFKIVPRGFTCATSIFQIRKEIILISTGSRELDKLLGGGVESGSITEIYGEFRTGKTQICHNLCITAQIEIKDGGSEGKALYIDTEGSFRPERLVQIADRYRIDAQQALDNVVYARALTTEHQQSLLVEAANLMASSRISVVIVDSVTSLFRVEYTGRGELADRQVQLGKFLRSLQRLGEAFGAAIVITNQVVATVDAAMAFSGPQVKPIGGNIIAHASTYRLALRKGRGEERIARLVCSPHLPEEDARFMVCAEGITDVKE